MTPADRRAANLLHGDSMRISDHLPLVVDFEVRPKPGS